MKQKFIVVKSVLEEIVRQIDVNLDMKKSGRDPQITIETEDVIDPVIVTIRNRPTTKGKEVTFELDAAEVISASADRSRRT